MKHIYFLLLFVTSFFASGQTSPFPTLKKITMSAYEQSAGFSYDPTSVMLINKKCTDLPKSDFLYCEDEMMETAYKVAAFKNTAIKDTLTIAFTFGMSMDPEFIFFNASKKIIGRISALDLYIQSNGIVYTSGHTNNMFDKKRKFELKADTLLEITQPFYYVGLKTTTTDQLTLYTSQTGKEIVAVIPKDYEIEVILAEFGQGSFSSEKYYLIKTKFGLLGWMRTERTTETKIKGLYYAGD